MKSDQLDSYQIAHLFALYSYDDSQSSYEYKAKRSLFEQKLIYLSLVLYADTVPLAGANILIYWYFKWYNFNTLFYPVFPAILQTPSGLPRVAVGSGVFVFAQWAGLFLNK